MTRSETVGSQPRGDWQERERAAAASVHQPTMQCNAWPRRRTDKSGRHDEKCGGAPQQQGSQSAGSLLLALAVAAGGSGRGASPEPGIEDEDQ